MKLRRRKGATLGLVAVCVLVIAVVGIGIFFMMKALGGGREVANATDSGTLNVAKMSLSKISVPAPAEFAECEYPAGSGITLLTYNRCVAKTLMVCVNATSFTPASSTANGNAANLVSALNKLGDQLVAQITGGAGAYFNNGLHNNTRMWGKVVNQSGLDYGWMKPKESSNIFFDPATLGAGQQYLKYSTGSLQPMNNSQVAITGTPTKYVAGYDPMTFPGIGTVNAVPVLPQQHPHLVSLSDFNLAPAHLNDYEGKFAHTPMNSFKVDASALEQKSQILGGAVAAAIVGAVNATGTAGGGVFGSGFEYPLALSYGYVEFGNMPANAKPPGYDPKDYSTNIFNNELSGPMYCSGNAAQNSNNVAFSQQQGAIDTWLAWADKARKSGNYTSNMPTVGPIFVGANGGNLNPGINGTSVKPTKAQVDLMAQMYALEPNPANCYTELGSGPIGLVGSCVAAIGAMEATYDHPVPDLGPQNNQQNFSQADWAKAEVLVAFEGKNASAGTKFNNSVTVDLTATPASGLGVLQAWQGKGKVPDPPPYMQVPTPYQMPIESIGSLYDLLATVQDPGCLQNTINQIANRAAQIKPGTTVATVTALMKSTKLPMANPNASITWQTANKVYMYLPGGNLTANLVCDAGPPPHMGGDPDGPPPTQSCYQNQYHLDSYLVDSAYGGGSATGDQGVHDKPFVKMNESGGGLYVIDNANWQPSSGADNNLGRVTYQESGFGNTQFYHIN